MRPIDGDKLIKNLQLIATCWSVSPFVSKEKHEGAVDMLREVEREVKEASTPTPQNEWVSVDERMPEAEFAGQQRGFYLVALSNGVVKELMYEFRHYENMMFDVGWHETAYPVTHWMPLPAPPDRRPPERQEDTNA